MKIDKEKHNQQLTVGELEKFINAVKTQHPKDYKDIPVYIGDDDELNGVHCAWYRNYIPIASEDNEGATWRDIIDESNCYQLGDDEVAIIISQEVYKYGIYLL